MILLKLDRKTKKFIVTHNDETGKDMKIYNIYKENGLLV